MSIRELRRNSRESFTLIELLVVISIIAILAALLLAAVIKVLGKKPETATATELRQMDGAIQSAMQKYGVEYIPSQIKLCQNAKSYGTSTFDQESLNFIVKTIGKNSPSFWNPNGTGTWQTTGINWAGSNTPPVEILEGEQCLVFFLGGIQTLTGTQYACHGFGPDAAHPDQLALSPADNIGPFYSFQSPRLAPPPARVVGGTTITPQYCAYVDAYGSRLSGQGIQAQVNGQLQWVQFYAYFSCYKKENGYNRYQSPYTTGSLATPVTPTVPSNAWSDCYFLQPSSPIWPYASSQPTTTTPIVYVNSKSWQILCAGLDGSFGPGTDPTGATTPYYWNPATYGSIPLAGQDDQANFSFGKLQFGK